MTGRPAHNWQQYIMDPPNYYQLSPDDQARIPQWTVRYDNFKMICSLCGVIRKYSHKQHKWLVPFGYSHKRCGDPDCSGRGWGLHVLGV